MAFKKMSDEEKELLRKQMVALIVNNNDTFLAPNGIATIMRKDLLYPRSVIKGKVEELLNNIIEDNFTPSDITKLIYCNPFENNPFDRLREINNSLCVLNNVETAKALIDSYYGKAVGFDSLESEVSFLSNIWMRYLDITLLKPLDPKDLRILEITFYLCTKKDLNIRSLHEYLANARKFEINGEDTNRMLSMLSLLEKEMEEASNNRFFYDKEFYQTVFLNLFTAIPYMVQFQEYLNEPWLVEVTPQYINMIKRKLKEFKLDGKIIQNKKSILSW